MVEDPRRQSTLGLIALSFLAERPMHAYKMFQLMQQRNKGELVNIASRNSLYQALNRLVRAGLAEIDSTERADNRPERTVFRISDAGDRAVRESTRALLADEASEFPSLPVALSLLMLLTPADVETALGQRLAALESARDRQAASLAEASAMQLPRLFVLDEEYRHSMLVAQIAWLSALLEDLRTGSVTWSAEWMAEVAARFEPGP